MLGDGTAGICVQGSTSDDALQNDEPEKVIKLQLKKPKHWQWQLSTSKSTAHICVPIIQLFDSKGRLLLETGPHNHSNASHFCSYPDHPLQTGIWHSSHQHPHHPAQTRTTLIKSPDENAVEDKPKSYKLQSSRAGTLLIGMDDVTAVERHQQQLASSNGVQGRQSRRRRLLCCPSNVGGFTVGGRRPEPVARYVTSSSVVRNRYNGCTFWPSSSLTGAAAAAAACSATSIRPHSSRENALAERRTARRIRDTHLKIFQSPQTPDGNAKDCYQHQDNSVGSGDRSNTAQPGGERWCDRHELQSSTIKDGDDLKPSSGHLEKEVAGSPSLQSCHRHLQQHHQLQQPQPQPKQQQHVDSMGANVSRHSSKGLSGRRSHSSSSICNGKQRSNASNAGVPTGPGDGNKCGSLPSYLDDRSHSQTCNNNQQDKVVPDDRIPPLGDGAPLHWKFSETHTVLCDQGYGSERSPEEEYPPPLPERDMPCHHHLDPCECYPFITPESTFRVKLSKSSRGLGLSVTGGIDSGGSWPGLIRIRRLFPHQPASACGLLNVGDLIMEVNGISLTGLTNYEALEVLRTAANKVDLKVCRPPPDVLSCVSPISEVPPPPPRREPPTTLHFNAAGSPEDDYYHGEFEVCLSKVQGSLGFTLRKEDDSALGHYVRALVREPALTDGRIRAGDKIIAVNDVEISAMSHEQAVQFLRQCGEQVKLRLYRDAAQTPIAALSPSETTPRASFRKANLRQEAVDMLNDIAVRKLVPCKECERNSMKHHSSANSNSAGRIMCIEQQDEHSEEYFHEVLLRKCSANGAVCGMDPEAVAQDLLYSTEDSMLTSVRPKSLDLYNPNQTPVVARKPCFNFSLAHNAYELNNLDADILDAPNLIYNLGAGHEDAQVVIPAGNREATGEPASMPYLLPSQRTTVDDVPSACNQLRFSHKNPTYQSAVQLASKSDNVNGNAIIPKLGNQNDQSGMSQYKSSEQNSSCLIEEEAINSDQYEILSVELNRGWNCRLGFSLQGAAGVTYVSAVYSDSVAAKDGRLKPGDRVIKVNDESVENMSTTEIIELLRIVRGLICIVVVRMKSRDSTSDNARENEHSAGNLASN